MADELRIGVDLSIGRHAFAGSARWAFGITRALAAIDAIDLRTWGGFRRLRRGGPFRKVANLGLERLWYEVAIPAVAAGSHRDVLLMPVNLVSGRTSIPEVATIHDLNFLALPGSYDPAYVQYARWQFGRSARIAAAITTVSGYSRDQISEILGRDPATIHVIYPGLDPVVGASDVHPLSRPYGLYVGATEPHKSVETAVDAWRGLGDLDVDLAIVGNPGRAHSRLDELARASHGRVHLVGSVSGAQLDRWYRHASVFVFPSRAEGFGYPPLEAMQRAVPVVAARAASLPEVLGDAALYFEPGSAEDLAEQVRSAMGSTALRASLVAAGTARAASYTWSRAAARMADVLHEAAER